MIKPYPQNPGYVFIINPNLSLEIKKLKITSSRIPGKVIHVFPDTQKPLPPFHCQ
jgi:hypothetical protein